MHEGVTKMSLWKPCLLADVGLRPSASRRRTSSDPRGSRRTSPPAPRRWLLGLVTLWTPVAALGAVGNAAADLPSKGAGSVGCSGMSYEVTQFDADDDGVSCQDLRCNPPIEEGQSVTVLGGCDPRCLRIHRLRRALPDRPARRQRHRVLLWPPRAPEVDRRKPDSSIPAYPSNGG